MGALKGDFGAQDLGLSGFKRTLTSTLSRRERGRLRGSLVRRAWAVRLQAHPHLDPLPEGDGALKGEFGAQDLGLSGFKRTLTLALSQRESGCSDRGWRGVMSVSRASLDPGQDEAG